jgi:hypothetical protein
VVAGAFDDDEEDESDLASDDDLSLDELDLSDFSAELDFSLELELSELELGPSELDDELALDELSPLLELLAASRLSLR